jgi:hypothetical protein
MTSSKPGPTERPLCDTVAALLPWHANGTLEGSDRAVVEAHTEFCAACRAALALERRIVESIRAPRDNIEQSPHAAWQKLMARLDADPAQFALAVGASEELHDEAGSPEAPYAVGRDGASFAGDPTSQAAWPMVDGSAGVARPRRRTWATTLGIAVAVQAAAIAILAVALVRNRQVQELPRFHTLARPDPTLAAGVPLVRIAFDSGVDERAARAVAAQIAARIIAGPSPENVYTFALRAASGVADDEVVAWLRRQSHVLLVEPVTIAQEH